MDSAKAHGFLIAGMINDHLLSCIDEEDELRYDLEGATQFCPRCCGPCAALAGYFATPRGRGDADAYTQALGAAGGYDWQKPNGSVDWDWVRQQMKRGWCPNHDDALFQRGQMRELFHE